jgi:hypothetical protein
MSATIAARSHGNATLSAPVRRPQKQRRKLALLTRLGRLAMKRPGRTLTLIAFSAVAGAILANALLFQSVRHPAPIISAPATTPPPRTVERRVETPAAPSVQQEGAPAPFPPARPQDFAPATREAVTRPPAAVAPAHRAPAPAATVAPARTTQRDPIADLINGVDMRPPAEIRGAGRPAPARKTVEN